jgi:membrane protein DedA with SNARE-associated domain
VIPTGHFAYLAIYLAAIVEGEIVFVAASVLVASGQLHYLGVLVAGALGAATGDQLYFYGLRGRLEGWLGRWAPVASRRDVIVARVRRHQAWMVLAIRFAPGLRIAMAAACAYAGVPPLRFSALNLAAAFVWATVLLALVSHIGPAVLAKAGLRGIWGAIIPGVIVLIFGWWLGKRET